MAASPAPAAAESSFLPDALPVGTEYRTNDQTFFSPHTLDDLTALRAQHPDAVLLAGATDLGLRLSKGRERWPVVISTTRVAELRAITVHDGAIEVGGAVTYSELLPFLDGHIPSFAALVRRVGSRQIRNVGTLAGNLATASPIGDSLPCLIALGATVELCSTAGARTLAVADFITGYRTTALVANEIIARISIPIPAQDTRFAAYKLAKRFDQDISTVVAAFRLDCDSSRVRNLTIAFGGMGPSVQRARATEDALIGRDWNADDLADLGMLLAQDFRPLSDHRGSNDYRLRAAAGLVRRFQWETRAEGRADMPLRLEAL